MNKALHIRRLQAGEPAFDIVARWRYDAFFAKDGITFEESRNDMRTWMDGLGYETALLAEVHGHPAGCCLFVREEIDPKHDLTPWLAALYVAPEFRKLGIASALVRAIEQHARCRLRGTLPLHNHRRASVRQARLDGARALRLARQELRADGAGVVVDGFHARCRARPLTLTLSLKGRGTLLMDLCDSPSPLEGEGLG